MSKLRKIIQTVIVASLFSAVLAPQAWARTAIGSFGVHVKTNLEAGDTLPDMNVGNSSHRLPQDRSSSWESLQSLIPFLLKKTTLHPKYHI